MAQTVKNLSATWETQVRSLGREDRVETEIATHSSVLAWRIPGTEEPGEPQSMRLQRVRHDWLADTRGSYWASQVVLGIKSLSANAGDVRDTGSIHGLGISPGGEHGNPVHCSCPNNNCLENSMDRGAWWAISHRVAKSRTQLKHPSTAHWTQYLWF